jgi:hypothetical protein
MSIVCRVEEHVAASTLFRHKSLDFEVWGIPEDDTARILYITADVIAVVTPPFADTREGERLGEFRAWLDGFIEGNAELSVSEDPDQKPPDAMLARVKPVEAEFWSIRVTHPDETPGIRSFGAFSDLDQFVALTWIMREDIKSFDEEVTSAIETWDDYFSPELPHKGTNLNEYLTTCQPV